MLTTHNSVIKGGTQWSSSSMYLVTKGPILICSHHSQILQTAESKMCDLHHLYSKRNFGAIVLFLKEKKTCNTLSPWVWIVFLNNSTFSSDIELTNHLYVILQKPYQLDSIRIRNVNHDIWVTYSGEMYLIISWLKTYRAGTGRFVSVWEEKWCPTLT